MAQDRRTVATRVALLSILLAFLLTAVLAVVGPTGVEPRCRSRGMAAPGRLRLRGRLPARSVP